MMRPASAVQHPLTKLYHNMINTEKTINTQHIRRKKNLKIKKGK